MNLSGFIQRTEDSEGARAKTLFWLRNSICSLPPADQIKVIHELIGDLRKAIHEYRRQPPPPALLEVTKTTAVAVSQTKVAVRARGKN